MRVLFFILFLGAAFLWSVESQATNIPPHAVNHGKFHARHPEAIPREGVTGKRVGCTWDQC